tara:strand:+ start:848 stop:1015 length:168 start_codon:yes stop_codon:yes gene_type:complete
MMIGVDKLEELVTTVMERVVHSVEIPVLWADKPLYGGLKTVEKIVLNIFSQGYDL